MHWFLKAKIAIFALTFTILAIHSSALQYAVNFDNYSYFYASAPSFGNVSNGYSIVFWFKTSVPSGIMFDNQLVNTTDYNAGNTAYDNYFGWYGGNLTFGVWNGSKVYISSSSSYADDKWHLAAGMINSTGSFLFVDGSLVGQSGGVNSSNVQNFSGYAMVGGGAQTGGQGQIWSFAGSRYNNTFFGSITDVQVYNSSLTSAQISGLYNDFWLPPYNGVAGSWLGNGDATSNLTGGIVDGSGFGNNGTLMNYSTLSSASSSIISAFPVLPLISLVNPQNNSYFNYTSNTFTFNYTSPASSTANCSLYLNGFFNQTNSTTLNNTNTDFNVNGLAQGVYNWSVSCNDSYGNYNSSANQTLTIITTPPAVNTVSPANNTTSQSSSVTIVFNYTSPLSPTANCSFYVYSETYSVWALDGGNSSVLNNTNTSIFTDPSVPPGVYPWEVNCTDLAGNENSTGVNIYTVVSPITVNLTSPANNSVQPYPGQFYFNVTGSNSAYDCNLYINSTPSGENSAVPNNTNTGISSNQTLSNGFYEWFVNCSAGGFSGVSQAFYVTFSNIVNQLNLMEIIPNPSIKIYSADNNVSFSLQVFNPGNQPETAIPSITTSNGGIFSCPQTTVPLQSFATVACTGNVSMNVSEVVVNASISPVGNGVSSKSITLYSNATFTKGVSVPDSSIIVILAFAFVSFFVIKKRVK